MLPYKICDGTFALYLILWTTGRQLQAKTLEVWKAQPFPLGEYYWWCRYKVRTSCLRIRKCQSSRAFNFSVGNRTCGLCIVFCFPPWDIPHCMSLCIYKMGQIKVFNAQFVVRIKLVYIYKAFVTCLAHSQCYVSTVIVLCHSLSLSLSHTHTHTQPVIVLSRDDVPYSLFPVLQYFFTVFESKRSILHLSRVY